MRRLTRNSSASGLPLGRGHRPAWPAAPAPAGPARRHVLQVDALSVEQLERDAQSSWRERFAALLVAVRVALAELFAADDVLIGVCAANREAASEVAIGPYANLLPLRGTVLGGAALAALLDVEQERLFRLLDRTDVPSSAVLGAAGLAEDDVRVHMTLEPAHVPFCDSWHEPGLRVSQAALDATGPLHRCSGTSRAGWSLWSTRA